MGLAVHESFGSWVAQVAEISLDGNRIRVHRVVCAIDCGVVVNPAGVHAQIESGVAFGLSAALYGRVTMKEGRVEQSNFHDYPVLRIPEMPVVEVHIVPSTQPPGGVGEPGTPPIAPAVANAIFKVEQPASAPAAVRPLDPGVTGRSVPMIRLVRSRVWRRLAPRPAAGALVAGAAVTLAAATLLGTRTAAQPRPSTDDGVTAFATVQRVLQHPRCQNCHIPGDAPLQFDEGRVHAQFVKRGGDGKPAWRAPPATRPPTRRRRTAPRCHLARPTATCPPSRPRWSSST